MRLSIRYLHISHTYIYKKLCQQWFVCDQFLNMVHAFIDTYRIVNDDIFNTYSYLFICMNLHIYIY